MGYPARFVFIKPPSDSSAFEARLRKQGSIGSDDEVAAVLKTVSEDVSHAETGDLYDSVIADGDLESVYQAVEAFIYGPSQGGEGVNGNTAQQAAGGDVSMEDVSRDEPQVAQTNGVQA